MLKVTDPTPEQEKLIEMAQTVRTVVAALAAPIRLQDLMDHTQMDQRRARKIQRRLCDHGAVIIAALWTQVASLGDNVSRD